MDYKERQKKLNLKKEDYGNFPHINVELSDAVLVPSFNPAIDIRDTEVIINSKSLTAGKVNVTITPRK